MRLKLTYANVVATLALFVAIGGTGAFAASQLGKNSVGSKQLKKNAVTTAKLKSEAVTAGKVKKGTLTGKQINSSTLGTVPSAQTAQTANSLPPAEPWHVVGAPGEPSFQGSWKSSSGSSDNQVGFYKDPVGVVHLHGIALAEVSNEAIFQLPPNFRPANGKSIGFDVPCEGMSGECIDGDGKVTVDGSGLGDQTGTVRAPAFAVGVSLEGITFRAES